MKIISILAAWLIVSIQCFAQSGKFNDNVTWNLLPGGTLVVEGTGDIAGVGKAKKAPFVKLNLSDKITTLDITKYEGKVGSYVFAGLKNLTTIKYHYVSTIVLSSFDPSAFALDTHVETLEDVSVNPSEFNTATVYYRVHMKRIPDYNDKKVLQHLHIAANTAPGAIYTFQRSKMKRVHDEETPQPVNTAVNKWELRWYYTVIVCSGLSQLDTTQWDYSYYTHGVKHCDEFKQGEKFLYGAGRFHYMEEAIEYCDMLSSKDVYVVCVIDGKITDVLRRWDDKSNGMRMYYGEEKNGELQGRGIAVMYDGTVKMGLWEDNLYMGHPDTISDGEFFEFPEVLPLDLIVKHSVERSINEWQRKGEFEKLEDWSVRVNEMTRKEKVSELYEKLADQYLSSYARKNTFNPRLGRYDADNETFLLSDSIFGNIIISLAKDVSPQQFRSLWDSLVIVPTYYYNGSEVALEDVTFWNHGQLLASYSGNNNLQYDIADINYDFSPINIPQGNYSKDGRNLKATPSDVDVDIPKTCRVAKETFVFIVANENYGSGVQRVPYALNDGKIFKDYCSKTLGVEENKISYYPDATYGQLLECVASIKQVSEAYDGDVKILFYYAGHAFPDEADNNAYLLPVDGNPRLPATAYSLHRLYSELGNTKAQSVICFIDACFSGATRQDDMLLASRGVVIKVKNEMPIGNMIVFTSSSEFESSMMYQEKSHGMFTYYLLKKLKERRGSVNLGELSDYIIREVKRNSVVVNQKLQTPQVLTSPNMSQQWRKINL